VLASQVSSRVAVTTCLGPVRVGADSIQEVAMSAPAQSLDFSNFAAIYERFLVGPLFQPWAKVLVTRIAPVSGERVLDVACGTGIVARTVRARLGLDVAIVGVDLSPVMLATARQMAPDIDWRQGNATSLPLGDGEQFDVVFCQQGLQFVPDKPAAAREFRRALAGGGRLGVATWRPDEEIPMFRQMRAVAERHVGPISDHRHSFADADALAGLLTDAGLGDVRVQTIADTTRVDDGPLFARLNTMALMGMSPAAKAMSEDDRAAVVTTIVEECVQEVLPRYADGTGIAFANCTNLATAYA
jgi:ubiquinone/menaquinone biosynthesis C-methylase UbiE